MASIEFENDRNNDQLSQTNTKMSEKSTRARCSSDARSFSNNLTMMMINALYDDALKRDAIGQNEQPIGEQS